jgi:hypothetical protein
VTGATLGFLQNELDPGILDRRANLVCLVADNDVNVGGRDNLAGGGDNMSQQRLSA